MRKFAERQPLVEAEPVDTTLSPEEVIMAFEATGLSQSFEELVTIDRIATQGVAGVHELRTLLDANKQASFLTEVIGVEETPEVLHARATTLRLLGALDVYHNRLVCEAAETADAIIKKRPGQFIVFTFDNPLTAARVGHDASNRWCVEWEFADGDKAQGTLGSTFCVDVAKLSDEERAVIELYQQHPELYYNGEEDV